MSVTKETRLLAEELKRQIDRIATKEASIAATRWVDAWADLHNILEESVQVITQSAGKRVGYAMRAKAAQDAIEGIIQEQMDALASQITTQQAKAVKDIITLTLSGTREIIQSQIPRMYRESFTQPVNHDAVRRMVERSTGQITARHYALSADATEAMKRALNTGVMTGQHPTRVAQQIMADVYGEFNGGVVRASTITRTEMLDVHRYASMLSEQANRAVVAEWAWAAELGGRTCPSCWSMHGERFPVDEPGPIDHHRGRCTRIPIVKPWEELGFTGMQDVESYAPSREEAEAAFDELTKKEQQEILGKRGYTEYKNGNYGFDNWSQLKHAPEWRDYRVTNPPPIPTDI